jgi:uncharacterized membrane protein/cell wall-associated NlpC family hydrolase
MLESPQAFLAAVLILAGGIPALAARSHNGFWQVIPPVVASYAITMILAVAGLWGSSPEIDGVRTQLLDTLLPALVFLLVIPCDLRAVARLGPRLLAAFAIATLSILVGSVVAWLLWRPWLPADGWQVLAAVAGGWIGGTANLVAVAGGLEASSDQVGLAVVTDTVCYSCWVFVLFSAAAAAAVFNRWAGSRPAAEQPWLAAPASAVSEPPTKPGDLLFWLGLAVLTGEAAAVVADWLPTGETFSATSWTLLLTTVVAAIVAQSPLRRLPGAARLGSAVLAVVVVTMASQATFRGLLAAPVFVAAGFTVIACHAAVMVGAARLMRLDLASCSVASLANIGGVASAPLMAALHAPALVPAAVLLALLGYLIGLPAALGLATFLSRLAAAVLVAWCGTFALSSAAWAAQLEAGSAAAPKSASPNPADPNPASAARQTSGYWLARCDHADAVLLDAAAVAAANARMVEADPAVHDLTAIPGELSREAIATQIKQASRIPARPLFHATGDPVTNRDRDAWKASLALDAIPARTAPRFGLIVCRSPIRRIPTGQRVVSDPDQLDLDLFQETAVFPGTPMAVLHHSADRAWLFGVTATYTGWIAADAVAIGSRREVFDYIARAGRVITGSTAATAFTPSAPEVSRLVLDMGTALPDLADWPRREPVNGQLSTSSYVVEVPCRGADGALSLRPALLPRSADSHAGPLPATRGNVIRQACKFLGHRYGWGHDYESRDCSGLVADVYRSLGLILPRNTTDQASSPAVDRTPLPPAMPRAQRLAAIARLAPGDLLYAPRHVMILLGHDPDAWIIHATFGGGRSPPVNGIVIVPLADVAAEEGGPIVDALTTLVRVLPAR